MTRYASRFKGGFDIGLGRYRFEFRRLHDAETRWHASIEPSFTCAEFHLPGAITIHAGAVFVQLLF